MWGTSPRKRLSSEWAVSGKLRSSEEKGRPSGRYRRLPASYKPNIREDYFHENYRVHWNGRGSAFHRGRGCRVPGSGRGIWNRGYRGMRKPHDVNCNKRSEDTSRESNLERIYEPLGSIEPVVGQEASDSSVVTSAGPGSDKFESDSVDEGRKSQSSEGEFSLGGEVGVPGEPLERLEEFFFRTGSAGNEDREVVEVFGDEDSESDEKESGIASAHFGENRLITEIELDEKVMCRALMDSGAQQSLLPYSVVEDLNIQMEPVEDNLMMQGFGINNLSKILGKVKLSVSIHGLAMEPCTFYVMETKHVKGMVILAVDFLQGNNISLDLSRRKIERILEGDASWECYVPTNEGERCTVIWSGIQCHATQEVVLDPRESKRIQVSSSVPIRNCCRNCQKSSAGGGAFFVEEITQSNCQLIAGIVDEPSAFISVIVVNNGYRREKVAKGTVLGTISSLVETEVTSCGTQLGVVTMDSPIGERKLHSENKVSRVELQDNLSERQKADVMNLLVRNEKAFGDGDEVGLINVPPQRIKLTDYTPIYQRHVDFRKL